MPSSPQTENSLSRFLPWNQHCMDSDASWIWDNIKQRDLRARQHWVPPQLCCSLSKWPWELTLEISASSLQDCFYVYLLMYLGKRGRENRSVGTWVEVRGQLYWVCSLLPCRSGVGTPVPRLSCKPFTGQTISPAQVPAAYLKNDNDMFAS